MTSQAHQETDSVLSYLSRNAIPFGFFVVGALLLFWPALARLVDHWSTNEDYSHGFLVPVVSAVVVFLDRRRLAMLPVRRSRLGLLMTLGGLACFLVGAILSLESVQRFAVWGTLFGATWFAFGGMVVRCLRFPLCFLVLAIPPPYFVLDDVRLSLKVLATKLSAEILLLSGLPAIPEGNVLTVAGQQFEVADACSGIRSLMAIVTTAVFVGYLVKSGFWKGLLLCAMSVPVTIGINILRVFTVALAATQFEVDLATGWLHDALGYATYALSFVFLLGIWWLLDWSPGGSASTPTDPLAHATPNESEESA